MDLLTENVLLIFKKKKVHEEKLLKNQVTKEQSISSVLYGILSRLNRSYLAKEFDLFVYG